MSDGTETWSFRYDADGLRTEATNGTVTYKYTYSGSSLAQLEISETAGSETTVTDTLYFAYDSTGPVSVTHNDVTYYYVTNLQGDIVAILNNSGTAVVTYTYDAWGNILSTSGSMASTLGALNPLRYRGYVFDTFSGFYYLQSRYYLPETGRFLNADTYASTGQGIIGNNMFAYCNNNPITLMDSEGNKPEYDGDPAYEWAWLIGLILKEKCEELKHEAKMYHYSRNKHNIIPSDDELMDIVNGQHPGWVAAPDGANRYHRFTHGTQGNEAQYNTKYMSPDKQYEIIICYDPQYVQTPYVVTDPVNVGTYNYGTGFWDHAIRDVLPYYFWGNSPDDTTGGFDRVFGRSRYAS